MDCGTSYTPDPRGLVADADPRCSFGGPALFSPFKLPNHGFSRPYLARRLLVRLVCPAIRFHLLVSLVNVDQGLDRMVVVRRYCWGRSVSSVFLPLRWSVANKNKRLGSSCLLYERFGATRQVRSRTNPDRKMHDASQECLRPKKENNRPKETSISSMRHFIYSSQNLASLLAQVMYQWLPNHLSADLGQDDKMVCKRRHGVFVTPPLFPSVTKRLSPWQSTTSCDKAQEATRP